MLDIPNWVQGITDNAANNIVVQLVGNKSDMDSRRQATQQEGQAMASQHKLLFAECSAKDSLNINDIFMALIDKILENKSPVMEHESSIKLKKGTVKEKRNCC